MPNIATPTVLTVDETALIVERQVVTGAATVAARTYFPCDATSGAFALTIPAAGNTDGRIIVAKKIDSSSNAVTVTRSGSDTIDGATTFVLTTQWDVVILVSDQDNDTWDILATYNEGGGATDEGVNASLTNGNAGSIVIGEPVYTDATGSVDEAQADAAATAEVVGLVADSTIANSASGNIRINGMLTATTGEWDTVTGGSGGLTAGSKYYLSAATAARLTTTAPSGTGEVVFAVGTALSTTQMKLLLRYVTEIE